MSRDLWTDIELKLSDHEYMGGVEREKNRMLQTAEVFTPSRLVLEILKNVDIELFAPGKKVLDPACGDGQFLVAAKWIKVFAHGMTEQEALDDIYGVDIMPDNVKLCRMRLGGGRIIVGNSLQPSLRIEGQTERDHKDMMALFSSETFDGRTPRLPRAKRISATTLF